MPDLDSEVPGRIGTEIRAMRKEYMLTQQQLADLAGISNRTLRDIENGSLSPSIGNVVKVLATLGLDLEVR